MVKKYKLLPAAMACIDSLEILFIVFTVIPLAAIEPNVSKFCMYSSTCLNFH